MMTIVSRSRDLSPGYGKFCLIRKIIRYRSIRQNLLRPLASETGARTADAQRASAESGGAAAADKSRINAIISAFLSRFFLRLGPECVIRSSYNAIYSQAIEAGSARRHAHVLPAARPIEQGDRGNALLRERQTPLRPAAWGRRSSPRRCYEVSSSWWPAFEPEGGHLRRAVAGTQSHPRAPVGRIVDRPPPQPGPGIPASVLESDHPIVRTAPWRMMKAMSASLPVGTLRVNRSFRAGPKREAKFLAIVQGVAGCRRAWHGDHG